MTDHVETWIFDLDNTLYPENSDFFGQISRRMTEFIAREFTLDAAAARLLQRDLYKRHGTTLRGLMVEHGYAPEKFQSYVHDIDLSLLQPDPALDRALASLPGRKFVHTNASVAHAARLLDHLGLAAHFADIFDIRAADWRPKPDPTGYRLFWEKHDIDPARACMIEDLAVNLLPASEAGVLTVWIDGGRAELEHPPHVDLRIQDLPNWLQGVAIK